MRYIIESVVSKSSSENENDNHVNTENSLTCLLARLKTNKEKEKCPIYIFKFVMKNNDKSTEP